MSSILGHIEQAARDAGLVLREGWGSRPQTQAKRAAADLVTEFDFRAERTIVAALSRAFPDATIVAEEGQGVSRNSHDIFYVDPLDGTVNFAHGLPIFAVSIGLVRDGSPVAGVVHAPILGWTFTGASGVPAALDGKPIGVSDVASVAAALVVTGFAASRKDPYSNIEEFARLTAVSHGTRRLGSAALDLCCVACGWLDGFWEHDLSPWDVAGGAAIVEAAAGRVTSVAGGPLDVTTGSVLATNGKVHDEMCDVLRRAVTQPR
jgi:myo-inositol-1(or 4)-monophosphatase